MSGSPDKAQSLLLVEDSAEDYEAVTRIFKKINPATGIFWCRSGADALDFLNNPDTGKSARPTLILLDLNMPGLDGRDTLRLIKGDSALKQIPVVIFTTSASDQDIEQCYRLGANAYVQKPFSYDRLVEVITGVRRHWFDLVLLPPDGAMPSTRRE